MAVRYLGQHPIFLNYPAPALSRNQVPLPLKSPHS
jgi:hypothetical protein